MGKPDIQAEMMTWRDRSDGRLEFHSFRFEVYDLPALVGEGDQLELAGEIMAVAVSKAGAEFHTSALRRVPDRFPTQDQLDDLNADLARKAACLADAISMRTDAAWWIDHRDLFEEDEAYGVIVGGVDRAQ